MAWVYSDYSGSDGNPSLSLLLSERSKELILAVMREMDFRTSWMADNGDNVSDAEWDEIEAQLAQTYDEVMSETMPDFTPVGTVSAFFGTLENLPEKWLVCDGTSYLGADYPELFEILPSAWISGSNFTVPDMTEKFIFGVTENADLGIAGGENTHVLTIDETPAHTHIQNGRNSPAGASLQSAVAVNVASTAAVATVTSTGSAGGGAAHNNVPAHITMFYMIKALP